MARGRLQGNAGEPRLRTNHIDPIIARKFIDRIEAYNVERLDLHSTYMRDCKDIRRDIRATLAEAKKVGIPPRVLEREIELREAEAKIEHANASMSEEERYLLGMLRDLLQEREWRFGTPAAIEAPQEEMVAE